MLSLCGLALTHSHLSVCLSFSLHTCVGFVLLHKNPHRFLGYELRSFVLAKERGSVTMTMALENQPYIKPRARVFVSACCVCGGRARAFVRLYEETARRTAGACWCSERRRRRRWEGGEGMESRGEMCCVRERHKMEQDRMERKNEDAGEVN